MSAIVEYVESIGRNPGEEKNHSHLYAHTEDNQYFPMCIYGWNRSNGDRLSILRGHRGEAGLCAICERRRALNLEPLKDGSTHKTKWL